MSQATKSSAVTHTLMCDLEADKCDLLEIFGNRQRALKTKVVPLTKNFMTFHYHYKGDYELSNQNIFFKKSNKMEASPLR